ncbi:MAG: PDZ domain-containing protein [Candidatus Diapherotrites archaeon]|nr:PDZ domain-containing protein [Candidatus Diapherotrites archaeon]
MISVERKYLIVFFVRWRGFLQWLKDLSRSKIISLVDESGPILLLGPILGRHFRKLNLRNLLPLLILSLLMIGGPVASLFTLLFGLMGAAFYLLGASALNILLTYYQGGTPLPGIGPVIPGVQVGPYYVPFLEGWLSILLIFLIHEGAHGAVALRRNIPIRDAAMVILGIVPVAAYVMPDEEEFKASPPEKKVSVLSAGPASNVFAFIPVAALLLLITPLLAPLFENYYDQYALGVKILEVPETIEINGKVLPSLVHGKLQPGDVILSIDDTPTRTFSELLEAIRSAEGNTITITFLRNGEEMSIEIPNEGYLGVRGAETVWKESPPLDYYLLSFLLSFLSLFALLNLMVAVVNALPFSIFDGGQAIEEVEKIGGIKASPLKGIALLLLLINVLPWFVT